MNTIKGMAWNVNDELIPRFDSLRWVPIRYRRVLPLRVMKRYNCIVVGAAGGRITVAITDQHNTSVIELLRRLTGRAIFPVLVNPARIRLLLHRIERCERYSGKSDWPYYVPRAQIHFMVSFFLNYS